MAIRSVAIRRHMTMPSMPQPVADDQDDNAANEVILGVDTHHDVHVAAVITALGVLLDTAHFPTTAAGYQALVGWVATFGILRRAGVEDTGSGQSSYSSLR
jgi:transposase